jgi:hypothetical protein
MTIAMIETIATIASSAAMPVRVIASRAAIP